MRPSRARAAPGSRAVQEDALLGEDEAGARLFDGPADVDIRLEQMRAVEAPGVTHIRYRVTSSGS